MADIQIVKIIVAKGKSIDLPHALDTGEMGFSTDEGRLFIGSDPSTANTRSTFPYKNIEILTERSTDLFSTMHGNLMRDSGSRDYYDARLLISDDIWSTVKIMTDTDEVEYRISNIDSVSAFIDYAVAQGDGTPLRMGQMQLTHYADFEGEPQLSDNSAVRRDMTLTSPSNYDAEQVYGRISFRFSVAGPINDPYLVFQYKNLTNNVLSLRFRISRPEATYYESDDR